MRIQCLFRLQIKSQGHSLGIGSLVCAGGEEVDVRLLVVRGAPRLPRAFFGGDVRLLEAHANSDDCRLTVTSTSHCRNLIHLLQSFRLLLDSRASFALHSEKALHLCLEE